MAPQDDSYWAGRSGTPGGNYDDFEYRRGQRDAQQWRDLTAPQSSSKPRSSDGGGGGGGAGIAALAALYFLAIAAAVLAVIATVAAAIAIVASPVVAVAARVLPGRVSQPYREIFGTTFFGICGLIAVASATWYATVFLDGEGQGPGLFHDLLAAATAMIRVFVTAKFSEGLGPIVTGLRDYWSSNAAERTVNIYAALWLTLPGLLTYALVLGVRIGGPFVAGFTGLLLGLVTAAVSFLPGFAFAAWGVAELARHAEPAALGSDDRVMQIALLSGALAFSYALIGGIVAALVLGGVSKLLGRPTGEGSFYGTSFLGLLIYGVFASLALFAYRGGDALLAWTRDAIASADVVAHVRDHLDALGPALLEFWPLQVVGLLAFACVVATRLRGPYAGALGFAKACIVTGVVALPLLIPFVAIAMAYVQSGRLPPA